MNPRFKIGDKVVAVDAEGQGPMITEGNEYVVKSSYESSNPENGGMINLQGIDGGFFGYRFELVEEDDIDIPVTKPLHITYCGVTITLDTQLQSSRKFAEVLLDLSYGKESA